MGFIIAVSLIVALVIGVVAVIIGTCEFCMMVNNEIGTINGKVD